MSMPGMETVVDAIVTALQGGMTTKVAELNTAYADSLTLKVPATADYLVAIDPEELEQGLVQLADPTVIVRGEDVVPAAGTNPDIGGEYELENAVVVSVMFKGEDIEARSRLAWRYARAVKEILLAEGSLTLSAAGDASCTFRGSGYLERTIPSGVWRDSVCLVSVLTYETP